MSATTVTPLSALLLASAERVIEDVPIAPSPVLIVVSGGQDDTANFITESKSLQPWLQSLAKGYGSGTEIVSSKTGVVGDSRGHTLGISFSKQSATKRAAEPIRISSRSAANLRRALNARVRSIVGGESEVALELTQGASHALVVLLAYPLRNYRPSTFLSQFGSKMRKQFSGLSFQQIRAQEMDGVWGLKGWYVLE